MLTPPSLLSRLLSFPFSVACMLASAAHVDQNIDAERNRTEPNGTKRDQTGPNGTERNHRNGTERNMKRHCTATVQLLHKLKIRAAGNSTMLLKVVKNPVTRHLPPGCKTFGERTGRYLQLLLHVFWGLTHVLADKVTWNQCSIL